MRNACPVQKSYYLYEPRNPQKAAYFQCVQDHFEWVFSIPKRLRVYFMTNRRLLAKLSQRTWKVLSVYLKAGVRYNDAVPGGVIAVQTFGDFQNFNPHLHIIATDGCFY